MKSVYKVAGIDVHKKMLAVVVSDVSEPGEHRFEQRSFGTGNGELGQFADWLVQQNPPSITSRFGAGSSATRPF